MTELVLTVNGRRVTRPVEPRTHLGDFLRESLNLTGTHLGCEHGVCGACTVLVDGAPARSCITLALACGAAEITTIEGLDADEIAAELRAAFTREHALQCGYCTPGMMVSARDLVLRLEEPDERRIRLGLSGNLCRCTGYVGIVRAVRAVIAERRARGIVAVPGGGRTGRGPVGSHRGSAALPVEATLRPATPAETGAVTQDFAALSTPFTPAARFDLAVALAHPPDRVFALLGDVAAVAACLPGAEIDEMPSPTRVVGSIRARLGPIAARFRGIAEIGRDSDSLSGRIVGLGAESGGRSSTKAEIRYRVEPDGAVGSRLAVSVGYTLTGMLAQFGRPGLVRDLAGRIADEFAARLDRTLAGETLASDALPGLSPAALLAGLARQRAARALRRVGQWMTIWR